MVGELRDSVTVGPESDLVPIRSLLQPDQVACAGLSFGSEQQPRAPRQEFETGHLALQVQRERRRLWFQLQKIKFQRIGDDDLVASVIKKAKEHDIDLAPEAVTVKRVGSVGAPAVYLATDYSVPVSLPGYSFALHFTPNSGNNTN